MLAESKNDASLHILRFPMTNGVRRVKRAIVNSLLVYPVFAQFVAIESGCEHGRMSTTS